MKILPIKCFVGVFDILGFSDLVTKGELKSVLETYVGMKTELNTMKIHRCGKGRDIHGASRNV